MANGLIRSILGSLPSQAIDRGIKSFQRFRYGTLLDSIAKEDDANLYIRCLVESGRSGLVSRIGNTEGRIVGESLFRGRRYGRLTRKQAHQNAGIFPINDSFLNRFSDIY